LAPAIRGSRWGTTISRISRADVRCSRSRDGAAPELISITTRGERLGTVKLPGVTLTDWEDVTIGPGPDAKRDYIYLADTGDNDRKRDSIQIVRLPEPDPRATSATQIEKFSFTYGDGKAHDAEAIFVDPITKRVFIVTKRVDEKMQTHVFATKGPLGKSAGNKLELVLNQDDAPGLDGRWVGASISASGDRIMLVQHTGKNRVFLRKGKATVERALSSPPCLAPRPAGQHESVALTPDGNAYFMVPEGESPNIELSVAMPTCPTWAAPKFAGKIASPFAQEISGARDGRDRARARGVPADRCNQRGLGRPRERSGPGGRSPLPLYR
jgi:hypothetical protein